MAGNKGQHILALLDEDFIHIVWGYDLGFRYGIGKGLPEVGQKDSISHLQIWNVAEIVRTSPATVACDHAVGVAAADRQTGLTQLGGSGSKVFFRGTQIDGHGQAQGWDLYGSEYLVSNAVITQGKGRLLLRPGIAQTGLLLFP